MTTTTTADRVVATSRPTVPAPPDPGLPGARGLFGAPGHAAGARFLHRRGWRSEDSRAVQALYHPGSSVLVRYLVRASTPRGERRVLSLCVETRARARRRADPPAEFAERYGLDDPVDAIDPYLVWAFPYDPSLEGLPAAAWGADVRGVVASHRRRPLAVSVEPLRYRPRRRAVFRYVALHRGPHGPRREVSYGKVLHGSKARRWIGGHGRWVGDVRPGRLRLALPVATAGADTVVLPALTGRSLRDLLLRGGALPSPDRVAALVDDLCSAIPPAAVAPPAAGDVAGRARAAAERVAALVPDVADAAVRVAGAVAEGADRDGVPHRVVHGDLYEAQVVVDDDFSLGLVDLDDVRMGDPAMDAANFTAHLVALAAAVPRARPRLTAYRNLLRAAFARRLGVGPDELAWREALCMLELATGPFRVLHPLWPSEVRRRVDLAVRLTRRGDR